MGGHALLQGVFLTQEVEPAPLMSPALVNRLFTTSATWEAPDIYRKEKQMGLKPLKFMLFKSVTQTLKIYGVWKCYI